MILAASLLTANPLIQIQLEAEDSRPPRLGQGLLRGAEAVL